MMPRLFNARQPFQDEFSKIFKIKVTNFATWSDPGQNFARYHISKNVNLQDFYLANMYLGIVTFRNFLPENPACNFPAKET